MGGTSTTVTKGGASSTRDPAQLSKQRRTRRITREIQRLEARYPVLQRMECMALMAGGLAHDFNNILMVIQAWALDLAYSSGTHTEHAGDLLDSVSRGKALTESLLSMTREETYHPQVVDLYQVVLGCRRMLRWIAGPAVEIRITSTEDLGRVYADPKQLEQVLLNLVINACHAMSGKGMVRIFLANRDPRRAEETGEYANPTRPGHVVLEVMDHGLGMDPQTMEQIFDPGFTTRPPSEGTGLGLFMVSSIVDRHNGTVTVESAPDVGSTFSVYLPKVH